jgi:murein DD-endopeptidase MepM/ murein hydrolase activator NlpD
MMTASTRLRRSILTGLLTILLLPALPSSTGAVAASGVRSVTVVGTGYVLPVPGAASVLTPFQAPASRYGPGHRGVDLAASVAGQVFAAGAGVVAYAGPVAGRGVVSIDHPAGIRTTYEPVAALVRAGDRVVAGQLIGTLQAGHPSCAPSSCLHWGARLPDGSYLDPMGLLDGLRVRLLPWAGYP